MAQLVNNLPAKQETPVQFLGWGDLLEKATHSSILKVSLVAQLVKNPPAMLETQVRSLGWEDPLENGTATHSSILFPYRPLQSTEQSSLCYAVGSYHRLVIYFIHNSVYMSIPVSQIHPPLPHLVSIHPFSMPLSVSISALQVNSSVLFFQVPYIRDIIRFVFLFLIYFTLYDSLWVPLRLCNLHKFVPFMAE